ncbi:MAG TPA: polysaccharide deacetylase family protein [Steroidobacteraceae bacterium]|jgi:peptidoglycan/xylan/chitin deacetylase (PgdA/CDA1 family)|nr:polysaccharide deacetylase family protein [Steroidobacteraceae bacterium]
MKKRLKSALGHVAGSAGVYARRFRSRMTIVAFHRVNDWMETDGLTCSSAKFESFCKFFSDHFRIVPLSQQVAGCRTGANVGGTLSITFDDGYVDNFEVAAPILKKLGLPAAFFVASGFLDTSIVAPWDRSSADSRGWMSWDQVRLLAAQGFEIGSHTHRHINLGATDEATIRADLRESKGRLLQELGRPAQLFAYPFGGRADISIRSRELVREEGFECCVSCFGGSNSMVADPFHLNRISIADWFESPNQFGFEMLMETF